MNHIGLVVVFIILFFWILILYYQSFILHNLLCGFWEADRSFCEESELDMFCLYFSKDYNIIGNRPCYVLAMQNNELILNEPTIASVSLQWNKWNNYDAGINSPKYFNITFKNISPENIKVFPKHQQIRFYPICGKIVLFYDNTITAVLYKNPVNTELNSSANKT